jgi:HPt (histidine-containing phosphotransfer) domain-containing protein
MNQQTWTPPETLRELEAAGYASLIPELVDEFISDTRARLARMREAVALSDAKLFKREAHSIKGSATQMGGDDVAALAKVLELEGESMPSAAARDSISMLEGKVEVLCRHMTEYMTSRV